MRETDQNEHSKLRTELWYKKNHPGFRLPQGSAQVGQTRTALQRLFNEIGI